MWQRLEQESRFLFNMRHVEEMVINGDWDEVEKYLYGFGLMTADTP